MLSKQLFYLSADQLYAYQWRAGRLARGQQFGADAQGLQAFGAYLQQHSTTPAYLVADLIEEDYQRLQLPHVGGRARRELVARRQMQLFRDTPYCHTEFQGREAEGRRDDITLFSALTNPQLLQPWLAALEQHKVPLAAIYSAPLLAPMLVQQLGLEQEHRLLVTQHGAGLRQSYFAGAHLKFSRLTMGLHDAHNIVAETAKTWQFLTSTRLLERGELLQVALLVTAEQREQLEPLCADGPEIAYDLIELDAAEQSLGLRASSREPASTECSADQLMLRLVARRHIASHYPLAEQARYYQLWQAKLGLHIGTGAALACAAVVVALNLWASSEAANDSERLVLETAHLQTRYRDTLRSLPALPTRSGDMKGAVQTEQIVARNGPTPTALMLLVSQALEQTPEINLTVLDWEVDTPDAAPAQPAMAQMQKVAGAAPIAASVLGIPTAPVQSLRIEADIGLANGDYRSALASMNRFAQQLARNRALRVEVLEPPLDVRPGVKLSGSAGNATADSKARFILKLVWQA